MLGWINASKELPELGFVCLCKTNSDYLEYRFKCRYCLATFDVKCQKWFVKSYTLDKDMHTVPFQDTLEKWAIDSWIYVNSIEDMIVSHSERTEVIVKKVEYLNGEWVFSAEKTKSEIKFKCDNDMIEDVFELMSNHPGKPVKVSFSKPNMIIHGDDIAQLNFIEAREDDNDYNSYDMECI